MKSFAKKRVCEIYPGLARLFLGCLWAGGVLTGGAYPLGPPTSSTGEAVILLAQAEQNSPGSAVSGGSGYNLISAGTYLYAAEDALGDYRGSLRVEFARPEPNRLVVAYGRRHRKDRFGREDTIEQEREHFKPVRASLRENGRIAVFDHLAPDFYDLVVIDDIRGVVHEGLQLLHWQGEREEPVGESALEFYREAVQSLSLRDDRIGGWEAFFDHKNFIRFDTDGERGSMLVQQMRLGRTLTGGGSRLRGTVHSLDVVWLERAAGDAGWQVVTRQQLYRNEIAKREFFDHYFVAPLQGIRVGVRAVEIGPIELD